MQGFREVCRPEEIELAILETAQPRHNLETNEMAKGEAHIAYPAGIDIVGFDGEIAAMIEQSIEDIDGFARIGIHGDDVESAVLVRGEPVEFGAGVGTIAAVEVADRLGVSARRKILAIGG